MQNGARLYGCGVGTEAEAEALMVRKGLNGYGEMGINSTVLRAVVELRWRMLERVVFKPVCTRWASVAAAVGAETVRFDSGK